MVIMKTVSVIFDTRDNYSFFPNKGYFVNFEEIKSPIKLKVVAKVIDIDVFEMLEYYVRSENGHINTLRYQAYNIPGLQKDLRIIYPQGILTSEG